MSKAKRKSGDISPDSDSGSDSGSDSDSDSDLGSNSESGSLSFEGALDQLEQTVARLEAGEMPLEEALELFEAGVKLSRQCDTTLAAAERRIEILIADRADLHDAAEHGATEEGEASEEFDFEDDSEDFED